MEFQHKSVLLQECIDGLNIKPDGIYVDGTMGGAGHSKEIVKKINDIKQPIKIMHVCGSHEHTIMYNGIRSMLPEEVLKKYKSDISGLVRRAQCNC